MKNTLWMFSPVAVGFLFMNDDGEVALRNFNFRRGAPSENSDKT